MGTVLIILKVVYVLVCIGLIAVVLIQQGKTAGLSGAISGVGESYWGKNKARSMEGGLHKLTVALTVVFLVFTMLINIISEIV